MRLLSCRPLRLQASTSELTAALREAGAVQLDGFWRGVDGHYLSNLLEMIVRTAVEIGWPLSAVPGEMTADVLAAGGFDSRMVLHCLNMYGSPIGGGAATLGADEDMISQHGPEISGSLADTFKLDEVKVRCCALNPFKIEYLFFEKLGQPFQPICLTFFNR